MAPYYFTASPLSALRHDFRKAERDVTRPRTAISAIGAMQSRSRFSISASRPRQGDEERKSRGDQGTTGAPGSAVITKTKPQTKRPNLYRVLLLNDDYTPMEFVVDVLQHIFQKNREEATKIMLHVHQKGVGICGVYTYEVAETKVTQTVDYARKNQHPLQCTLEKE